MAEGEHVFTHFDFTVNGVMLIPRGGIGFHAPLRLILWTSCTFFRT